MRVEILDIEGLWPSLLGLGLSYGVTSGVTGYEFSEREDLFQRMLERAKLQVSKGSEERKFLRQIAVWLDINAPRYWWMQAATYKFAESQSESIEHTILKDEITDNHFENGMDLDWLDRLNSLRLAKEKRAVRDLLPESFLQRRIVSTNMECLRNILHQRRTHKMPEWGIFCEAIESELDESEILWMVK
jgi:hypothetical protein